MKIMRKFMVCTVILVLFLNNLCCAKCNISADSAIVIDAHSKTILFEKNAYVKKGPASTTKILTALLAIEQLNTTDIVSVSPFAAETEGSSIWLSPYEKISVEDLLYGLLLSSGNDAAVALAEAVSGNVDAFSILMNERAKEIGCKNTNFSNPHGLPDNNHFTTCFDLSLISAEAMKNNLFCQIVKTRNKTISNGNNKWGRTLSNHNKLLKLYECSVGIKTGYTKKDGRCLVSCSEKDGRRIIIVTLSAPDDWNDHIKLSEYCFNAYPAFTVFKKGDRAGIIKDENGRADDIMMSFKEDLVISVKTEDTPFINTKIDYCVVFPVKKGDKVADCKVFYKNDLIYTAEIVSENNAEYKTDFITVFTALMKGLLKK